MPYLNKLQLIMSSRQSWNSFIENGGVHIWQADGRPMSGDIGKGSTHKTVLLANSLISNFTAINNKVTTTNSTTSINNLVNESDCNIIADMALYENNKTILFNKNYNKHFIQLAGGTNNYTFNLAKSENLLEKPGFGGFAFGGYARKLISVELNALNEKHLNAKIEDFPDVYDKCLEFAKQLVFSVKK
jgi:hypothetical protein